jgi:hypothetical protein
MLGSLLLSLTLSLSGNGEGLGTVGLHEAKLWEFATDAGFSSVRRIPMDKPIPQTLRADILTMIAFRGQRDPQEAATGSDTNPRSETLARHRNWSGGTSSRRLGKRWTSDRMATRPSSRASGAPRQ